MEQEGFERLQKSKLYRFLDMACRLLLVNLVMILLSLCGLAVFGLFPALFAAAAYFNDMMEGRENKMLPQMFFYFKKYFVIGNLLMLIVAPAAGIVVYLAFGEEQGTAVYLLLFLWLLVAAVLSWYLPAVTMLYPDFPLGKKFVFSLVAACDRFAVTLLLLVVGFAWAYAVLLIPQLFLFFVFSVPAWFGMWRIKKTLRPDSFYKAEEEE